MQIKIVKMLISYLEKIKNNNFFFLMWRNITIGTGRFQDFWELKFLSRERQGKS